MRRTIAHILASLGEGWYWLAGDKGWWFDGPAYRVFNQLMLWSHDVQGNGPGPWKGCGKQLAAETGYDPHRDM